MTRDDSASASIAGRMYSQRPWMPGISTIGAPVPQSMICISSPNLSLPAPPAPAPPAPAPPALPALPALLLFTPFLPPWSVPQRFPRLQRVLDALECLALSTKLEKRFTLQIQHIVFAHRGLVRQSTARQDPSQGSADQRVVIADASGPPRQVHPQVQTRQDAFAADRNGGGSWRRPVSVPRPSQRHGLRVRNKAFTIHRDRVGRPQQPEPAS